jgi:PAS domain S-box-containing protein
MNARFSSYASPVLIAPLLLGALLVVASFYIFDISLSVYALVGFIVGAVVGVWGAVLVSRRISSSMPELKDEISERKRAEAALGESQRKFQIIADYTYDWESWFGSDGQLQWVNRAVSRMTGYTTDECLSMAGYPLPLVLEEDRNMFAGYIDRARAGEEGNDQEFRIQHKDGHVIPAAISWQPAFDDRGHSYGFRTSVRNIADRKRAESALEESRRKFQIIADYTYDWESWFGSDGTLQWVNPAVARMSGYSVEECLSMPDYPLPLVLDDDREMFAGYLDEARAGVAANDQEFRIRHKDGHVIPAAISWQPAFDSEDRNFGFRTSVRNIADRKRAEEALKENELRLEARVRERTAELADTNIKLQEEIQHRTQAENQTEREKDFAERLVETAPAIVLLLDTDGRVVRFNPYMNRISGYTLSEVLGKSWVETFLPARHRHAFRALFVRAIADTPVRGHINPIVTKDGQEREIEWYDTTLKDPEGSIIGLLCVGQDITERKLAENDARRLRAELAHVNRVVTMGELATGLAHEINQPLCAILTNAEAARILMTAESPQLERLRETLDDISAQGQRSVDIINRLRAFIKRQEPKSDELDLNQIIGDSVKFLRIDQQLDLRVRLDLDENLSRVTGDRIQIQQVLLNLMRNGLDAMSHLEAQSKILILSTSEDEDGTVRVSVSDRGVGVPAELLERIFEPFFTTKDNGIGMGLSICRSIVESHGGKLWATRNSEEGTTLHFSLPRAKEVLE